METMETMETTETGATFAAIPPEAVIATREILRGFGVRLSGGYICDGGGGQPGRPRRMSDEELEEIAELLSGFTPHDVALKDVIRDVALIIAPDAASFELFERRQAGDGGDGDEDDGTPQRVTAAQRKRIREENLQKLAAEALRHFAIYSGPNVGGASNVRLYCCARPFVEAEEERLEALESGIPRRLTIVPGTQARMIREAMIGGRYFEPIVACGEERGIRMSHLAERVAEGLGGMGCFKLDEEPPLISFDSDVAAFNHLDERRVDEAVGRPTPAWDQFLDRLDRPDHFLAWVWGSLEPDDRGRQALWLFGPNGNDGKSFVSEVLAEIHGRAASVSSTDVGSQFFFSKIYGNTLAIFPDAKSPNVISTAHLHQLLGGDICSIEFKGRDSFSAQIRTKLLISSNILPKINGGEHSELSRVLVVKVTPPPRKLPQKASEWRKGLLDEKFAMLARAREAYGRLADHQRGGILVEDEELDRMRDSLASDEDDLAAGFIDEVLEFGEDETCIPANLIKSIESYLGKTSAAWRAKATIIQRLQAAGCEKKKVRIGKKTPMRWVGFKLRAPYARPQ